MKEFLNTVSVEKKEDTLLPEIEGLREPTKRLLEQLRPYLENGEYQFIIGHDSSGRIPTLLLRSIIKEIYKKNGHKTPPTVFLATRLPRLSHVGSYEEYSEAELKKISPWAAYVKKHILPSLPKGEILKVLVITDSITTGDSLRTTKKALEALDGVSIMMDAAVMGIDGSSRNENTKNWLSQKIGGQIFYGQEGTPSIYQKEELSGVQQAYPTSQPFANVLKGHSHETETRNPRKAREDVRKLADELYEWYKKV